MRQSKTLLNLTPLITGGAIQVASATLHELQSASKYNWHIALTPTVLKQIDQSTLEQIDHTVISTSPAKNRAARKALSSLEEKLKPDLVFTLFGPSYITFKQTHICGLANPWMTHPDEYANSTRTMSEKLKIKLSNCYRKYKIRQAELWHVEAPIVKRGALERLGLPEDKIFVIPNEVGAHYRPFLDQTVNETVKLSQKNQINALIFCAAYPHKNLPVIIPLLKALHRQGIDLIHFHLTLPEASSEYQQLKTLAEKNNLTEYIHNHGPIPIQDGPALYQKMDVLFFPTLLECYSVTPLEAICMNKPILISQIPAHTDIFNSDDVFFFDPLAPEQIAEAFEEMLRDDALTHQKTITAKEWLRRDMASRPSRFEAYMALIERGLN